MAKECKRCGLNRRELIPIALIIIIFSVAVYLYPFMPEQMPTHWNAKGEIDDYGSRFMGLFLMPLITLGIYILFSLIPKIAVYKKHILGFDKHLYGMKIAFVLFLSAIYVVTLLPTFGYDINVAYFILPFIAALIFYIGYIIKFIKRNFFIGIRTPWTLSSGQVWDKTHRIGSVTFRINALIFLLALFYPEYSLWIILVPLLANVLFLIVYSYFAYQKVKRK
ncbi:DUF1648 domain-containing protein [Candidatus Woesearchaeota archaeon]|nr:DUF1648 domain-containing protein [Candidatus Woesearchaeota archaeon]